MIGLLLLACASDPECGTEGTLCDQGATTCDAGESVTLDAPLSGDSYDWQADPDFLDAGGTMADDGHDYVVMTCPACTAPGDYQWDVEVTVTAASGGTTLGYTYVVQHCE